VTRDYANWEHGKFIPETSKYLLGLNNGEFNSEKIKFIEFKNPNNIEMVSKINVFLSNMAESMINFGVSKYFGFTMREVDEETFKLKGNLEPGWNYHFETHRNDENGISLILKNESLRSPDCVEFFNFNKNGDLIALSDAFNVQKDIYIKRLYDICVDAFVDGPNLMNLNRTTKIRSFYEEKNFNSPEELKDWLKNEGAEDFIKSSWKGSEYSGVHYFENWVENHFILYDDSIMLYFKSNQDEDSKVLEGKSGFFFTIPLTMINDILSDEYATKTS
jgi:hypothetical protein